MHTNTKSTPKSCSCRQCRRGKHSSGGRPLVELHERRFRHNANQQMREMVGRDELAEIDTPQVAPAGNYFD